MQSPVRKPAGVEVLKTSKDLDDKCLAFIADYIKTNGYPPSVREIGAHVGNSSSSTIHRRLARLQDEGRLKATRRGSRTLKLEVVK